MSAHLTAHAAAALPSCDRGSLQPSSEAETTMRAFHRAEKFDRNAVWSAQRAGPGDTVLAAFFDGRCIQRSGGHLYERTGARVVMLGGGRILQVRVWGPGYPMSPGPPFGGRFAEPMPARAMRATPPCDPAREHLQKIPGGGAMGTLYVGVVVRAEDAPCRIDLRLTGEVRTPPRYRTHVHGNPWPVAVRGVIEGPTSVTWAIPGYNCAPRGSLFLVTSAAGGMRSPLGGADCSDPISLGGPFDETATADLMFVSARG